MRGDAERMSGEAAKSKSAPFLRADAAKLANLAESRAYLALSDEAIERMLANPAIHAVSFSLLDCLLLSPCLFEEDLFYLVDQNLQRRNINGFLKMRSEMELEFWQQGAGIADIYRAMAAQYRLGEELCQTMMQEELDAWRNLACVNPGVKKLYDCAQSMGKRLALIDDTRLPEDFLAGLLAAKGYAKIDGIFLSGGSGKGCLYPEACHALNLEPYELLHIGPDLKNDYYMAQKQDVCAVWRPQQTPALPLEAIKALPQAEARLLYGFMRCHSCCLAEKPDAFASFVLTAIAPFALACASGLAGLAQKLGARKLAFEAEPLGRFEDIYNIIFPGMNEQERGTEYQARLKPESEPLADCLYIFPVNGAACAAVAGAPPRHKGVCALLAAFLGRMEIAADYPYAEQAKARYGQLDALLQVAAEDFKQKFAKYAPLSCDLSFCLRPLEDLFQPGAPARWAALDYLPAPQGFEGSPYLKEMLLNTVAFPDGLSGTGFDCYVRPEAPEPGLPHLKIGLHLHLWDRFLYQEFLHFLHDFPAAFDLYVTVGAQGDIPFTEALFANIPALEKLEVLVFPNRGRDMSSWLIGMHDIQENYDLFGNVHSKLSLQTPKSAEWRDHLLLSLLGRQNVLKILASFARDKEIGCVFPGPSPWWSKTIRKPGWNMLRAHMQKELIPQILRKLGIDEPFMRSDMIFSQGTMYWYRPQAFRQFFEAGITLEDFHPEPVPEDNTFVHAAERLFPFVCGYNGYKSLMV